MIYERDSDDEYAPDEVRENDVYLLNGGRAFVVDGVVLYVLPHARRQYMSAWRSCTGGVYSAYPGEVMHE